MLNRLVYDHSKFVILAAKRSATIQSNSSLGYQMKTLNSQKQFEKSLDLFDKYKKNRTEQLSSFIITQALKACAQIGDLKRGSDIHNDVLTRVKNDSSILASLIHLYMQCGDIKHAELLFKTPTKKTLFIYAAMMKGYIKNNMPEKAIKLFNEIKNPDEVIIILLFNVCAQVETPEALHLIKKISSEIPKTFLSHDHLLTSLIDALMKCSDVNYAQSLFNTSTKKNLFIYGAMMKGYVKNNMPNKAIELFNEIKNPDEVIIILLFNACAQVETPEALHLIKKIASEIPKTFLSHDYLLTSLIDALMKCGGTKHAQSLFNMSTKKTLEMYGAMMKGYVKNNMPDKAIELFNEIKIKELYIKDNHLKKINLLKKRKIDDMESNLILNVIVINALAQIGDFSLCQPIIEQIPNPFLVNREIQNSLIDMWGKVGCIDRAKQIFENVSQPDDITYSAMINGYCLNGMGIEAVKLFHQVPPKFIEESTYVCALNACSHSGLINEARSIFRNIQMKTSKIYTTMIDCLSRGSLFEEAQQLIDEYECHHPPTRPMYMSLLSGARNMKNYDLSEKIYYRMKKIFPESSNPMASAAILLANVYASSGDMDKASNVRIQLHESGIKKKVGLSWTVVNGQTYQFKAHDQSHPRSSEIYAEVQKISEELIKHGHQYDSNWITRPLHADETVESVLCAHSERLAIAWNFVVNPNASRIQVTKNLRVCGDCHQAIKLIALIRQCDIVVRDANRIHHFHKNGQCSCNDYY